MSLAYTMTNETISVLNNGSNVIVRKGAPNFALLRDALIAEDWDAAVERLTVKKAIANWCKGKFKVDGDNILFDGEALPQDINARILKMVERGEDPSSVCNFWERLQKNPSMRSVNQLWRFLDHAGIPLTPEGMFLAYKSVQADYMDHHSNTIDNSPGKVISMERNKISDDPQEACHFGLHVGALNYARSFGGDNRRIVVVEIDPADVVCVPYDCNHEKMRVCKYKVLGNHNGDLLPSTSFTPENLEFDDPDGFEIPILTGEMIDNITTEIKDQLSAPEPEPIKLTKPVAKKYAKFNQMDFFQLLNQSTKDLRDYATNGLKIIGASKIIGGKVALCNIIKSVRR